MHLRDIIEEECRAYGVAPEFGTGGKHNYATWMAPDGRKTTITFSVSPSDHRVPHQVRSDTRRALRDDFGTLNASEPIDSPINMIKVGVGGVRCSSLDIAKAFGKEHKDVLRSIDRICLEIGEDFTERNFALSEYQDSTGRRLRSFDLTRDGFAMTAMSFTGSAAASWKVRFLGAFNAMESRIASLPQMELQTQIDALKAEVRAAVELLYEVAPAPAPLPVIEPTRQRPRQVYVSPRAKARKEARAIARFRVSA